MMTKTAGWLTICGVAVLAACGGGGKGKPEVKPSATPVPRASEPPPRPSPSETAAPEPSPEPTPTPPPAPGRTAPEFWVGVWHACPEVGSGYCERVAMWADGRYQFAGADGPCGPGQRAGKGSWKLQGEELQVVETERVDWVGGKCVEGKDGMSVNKGGKAKKSKDATSVVKTADCTTDEKDSGGGDCAQLNGKPHWRLSSDPDAISGN